MRKVKTAAVQMRCEKQVQDNIAHAEELVRKAAAEGAQIILLPELFERPYFCQERRYEYYQYAKPVMENEAVCRFRQVARELSVVLPVSFYERDRNLLFNSVAVLDADGSILGIYRKTHIPDDHYYQEKFYFTPGDTGFRVFETRYGTIGVGICWDQWFPETARFMAVKGAELLYYPTAIGSEPILSVDSMPHWRRVMQGHAAANLMPVIAANRIGTETVEPCPENGNQKSALRFYGSSFITDGTGEIAVSMEVAMPMFNLAFKCESLGKGEKAIRTEMVADLAAEALFGESSELYLRLYEQGLIDSSFGGGFETIDGCAMLLCSGDSQDPRAVREAILAQGRVLAEQGVPEETFQRMKRSALGRRIRSLDSFDATCFRVCAYHFSDFDYFRFPEVYRSITAGEIRDFLDQVIRPERCSLSVVNPLENEGGNES